MIKKIFSIFIHLSKLFSRKNLMPFLKKEFANIEKNHHVLNIGAGGSITALLKKYAKETPFAVTTLDIDAKHNPDIKADICTYQFPKTQKYSVIIIAEVLEHLHSPHLAINNIKNILKPNGTLILTAPFIFPIHESPYDYYRYTKYGLAHLLKDFTNLEIKERNSWTEAIMVLWVRIVMDKKTLSRLVAPLIIIIGILLFPLYYLLGKIIRSDFITTGYTVHANL